MNNLVLPGAVKGTCWTLTIHWGRMCAQDLHKRSFKVRFLFSVLTYTIEVRQHATNGLRKPGLDDLDFCSCCGTLHGDGKHWFRTSTLARKHQAWATVSAAPIVCSQKHSRRVFHMKTAYIPKKSTVRCTTSSMPIDVLLF